MNFVGVCQPDWAEGAQTAAEQYFCMCLEDVSGKDEHLIWYICPHHRGWAAPNSLGVQMEQKVKEGKVLSLEPGRPSSPALGRGSSWFLGLQTPELQQRLLPWSPGLGLGLDGTASFPGSPAYRWYTSEPPRPREPIPVINFLLYMSLYSLLVPSVWSTLTDTARNKQWLCSMSPASQKEAQNFD